jgi:hypothetical protein
MMKAEPNTATARTAWGTTLRNLQGFPESAYTLTARTMAECWASWDTLPLLEQFAVIADFTAMVAESDDQWTFAQCAQEYRRSIGPNLRGYARCTVLNMRAAYQLDTK